jgi:hypothetical protein
MLLAVLSAHRHLSAGAQASFDLRLPCIPQRVINYAQARHADLDPLKRSRKR